MHGETLKLIYFMF